MKSDFYTAIAQIAAERGMPPRKRCTAPWSAPSTKYTRKIGIQDDENIEVGSIEPPAGRASSSAAMSWTRSPTR